MRQHFINHDFISQNKLQRLRTASQRPLPNCILPSHPIYNHCWFVHECEQLSTSLETMLFVSNICFKYAPKWMVLSLIFQKNSGEEQRAPSPNTFPRFRSGFALRSGFTLNSWTLRTLYSGFALDYQALRSLDSGFTLNFQLAKLVWPQKYIPGSVSACPPRPFGEFRDRLLIINNTDWL